MVIDYRQTRYVTYINQLVIKELESIEFVKVFP